MQRRHLFAALAALLLAGGLSATFVACGDKPQAAVAFKVTRRDQLVGGQRALGELGDYKLSNGIIHAIVQEVGHSRGFGAFGGSLIDVDLVRGTSGSAAEAPAGSDGFTELFPAFFLEAVEPKKVEVLNDGKNGEPAVLRVSGKGGDFLSLTKAINDLALSRIPLDYQVDYVLEPGKRYLKMVATVTNPDPVQDADFIIDNIPFGFISLLGEGQRLFVPGKGGYDMRFRLEDIYQQPGFQLEALPGEVTSMVTTEGSGVSYGIAADAVGANYLRSKPDVYVGAQKDSLLVPIASGSFLGIYWGRPPTLAPKKSYQYTGYLAVGSGDVASVQEVLYDLKQTKVGSVSGLTREAGSGQRVARVRLVFEDAQGNLVSSARSDDRGHYRAPLPPGTYTVYGVDSARAMVKLEKAVTVEEGKGAHLDLAFGRPAQLSVRVVDAQGAPLPAKVSVEAISAFEPGKLPRQFLYDLKIGQRMRVSDFTPDTADPATRRYMERILFAPNGTVGTEIKPGKYKVWATRGIEYDLASQDVELEGGSSTELTFQLQHVLPTPGYVSGDFHVHSVNSVDSAMALPERVASYAVEGVDYLSSTDHNYISDFEPTVQALGLEDFLKTTVGLELTSLEMGHFNAFPLKLDPGPVTHGSFNWFRRPPSELWGNLRALGRDGPESAILQVNHPRDGVLGYFSAFNVHPYTMQSLPPTQTFALDQTPLPDGSPSPYHPSRFSLEFDVLEVFNGKHSEQLHDYRVPANPPPGDAPTQPIPDAGEVLEETVNVPQPDGGTLPTRRPVYPGVLDDYYALTGLGRVYTAVGNSDSHSAAAEAGLPRTYLRVGPSADGSMRKLDEAEVFTALRKQRAIVTNGPFVELFVNGAQVGDRVVAADGVVNARILVQAAPWVDVTRVRLLRGGADRLRQPEVVARFDVAVSREKVRLDQTVTLTVPDRSFLAVEVEGDASMWPVFTPYEIPSIQITDAVGSLGSTFGFTDKWGRYKPVMTRQVTPEAFTNPIWIDRVARQNLRRPAQVTPLGPSPGPRETSRIPNLTKLFETLHGHAL